MDKNYSTTDHSAALDGPLSLPHFDEDATLLSARPVVPLQAVRAETRSRRRLIFGLTIVAAVLLGAITAVLLLMQNGQNLESAADAGESQLEVSNAGASGGTTSESAEARVPVITESVEEPQPREVFKARDSSIKKRQTVARSTRPPAAGSPDNEADENFESDESSLRRIERRNARREARREHRQRREQTGDDLLRIREIFEGYPRP